VSDAVTGGLDTVGLRVPAHPLAYALLHAFGGGVAAPSANRFGAVSPTLAAHVRDEFGPACPLILDGGPCAVGVESTIVDLSSGAPALLRPGGVAREEIEAALRVAVPHDQSGKVRSPGQLASHYAPRARVVLCAPSEVAEREAQLRREGLATATLACAGGDPRTVARQLYSALREADARGAAVLLATLPAESGLGAAIADRLRKAAGPR
jgi:L-threonylcarbamoyladenylate synthase